MGVEHHDKHLCDAQSHTNSDCYCHRHSHRYGYRDSYGDGNRYRDRDRDSYRDGYGPNPNAIPRLWQHGFFAGAKR